MGPTMFLEKNNLKNQRFPQNSKKNQITSSSSSSTLLFRKGFLSRSSDKTTTKLTSTTIHFKTLRRDKSNEIVFYVSAFTHTHLCTSKFNSSVPELFEVKKFKIFSVFIVPNCCYIASICE